MTIRARVYRVPLPVDAGRSYWRTDLTRGGHTLEAYASPRHDAALALAWTRLRQLHERDLANLMTAAMRDAWAKVEAEL